MHGIEDVLVHCVDVKSGVAAQLRHFIDEITERDGDFVDIRKHNHGKVFAEDGLRNVYDVHAVSGAGPADLCDDSEIVLSGDRNYSFHYINLPSFKQKNILYDYYIRKI